MSANRKPLPPLIYLLKKKANIFKTIYINFKFFSWKTAKKLPIVVFGRIDLGKCEGEIILKDPPRFAMLILGAPNPPNINYGKTVFWVDGTLEISDHIRVYSGSSISVSKDAVLSIGKQIIFNVCNRVWCWNNIQIGSYCRFSWDTQIFDSNFHYMMDTDGMVKSHRGKVVIGDSCWIGNRVTINKGTVLPNQTIVAACSFVNKDFSSFGEAATIGGLPAKFITQGVRRIVNLKKELEIDAYFKTHKDEEMIKIDNDTSLFQWY